MLGTLGVGLLAGCDLDDLRPAEARRTAEAAPSSTAGRSPDPDAAILAGAVRRTTQAWRLADQAATRPRLRDRLAGLRDTQLAHLDVLGAEEIAARTMRPRPTLADVVAAEQRRWRTLTRSAGRATSGPLARLLASMAASSSQHLAELGNPTQPSVADPLSITDPEVWQEVLGAEQAAVSIHGLLGARFGPTNAAQFASAQAAYAAHRLQRDEVTSALVALGVDPAPGETAYAPPNRLGGLRSLERAAQEVERRCATTYAGAVARTAGAERTWAITALNDSAVRVLTFRGIPEMFPGADEYTDR